MSIFSKIFRRKKERILKAEEISLLSYVSPYKAEKVLQEFIKNSKEVPNFAYLYLGSVYRKLGKYSDALRTHKILLYEKELSDYEKQQLYYEIALDYLYLGKSDEAMGFLKKINRDELKKSALKEMLRFYLSRNECENVMNVLKKMEQFQKDASDLFAFVYIKSGDEKYFKRIKKKSSPLVYYAFFKYYRGRGDFDRSLDFCVSILKEFPEYSFLVFDGLEDLLYEAGRLSQIPVIFSNIENPWVKFVHLIFYSKTGESQKVKELVEDIIQSSSESLLLKHLFIFLKNSNEYSLACMVADKLIEKVEFEWVCRKCGYRSRKFEWFCPSCLNFSSFVPSNAVSSTSSSI